MRSLLNSMPVMLDEFYYGCLELVSVSALTGAGIDGFLKTVEEYAKEYKAEMGNSRAKGRE